MLLSDGRVGAVFCIALYVLSSAMESLFVNIMGVTVSAIVVRRIVAMLAESLFSFAGCIASVFFSCAVADSAANARINAAIMSLYVDRVRNTLYY
jgi:hypothetical protein